jgi:ATP-binding cassette subfamily B (MDR/TAP) protein 1
MATDASKGDQKKEPDAKEEDKKKEPTPMVPFSDLYRYRDSTDTLCLIFGAIGATANGAAIPAFSELWGRLMNSMSDTKNTKDVGNNVAQWSEILTYVGIGILVCSILEVGLYMLSAERQIRRIRAMYMTAALAQDMAFFDENTPGEIGARLAGDTKVMQVGMGEKISNTIHNTSAVFAGIIFGFIKSWRLTLVILSVMPLLAAAGGVLGTVLASLSDQSQESYSKAGSLATQAIENIRTVQVFNAIPLEILRYEKHVSHARAAGIKKHFVTGLTTGTVYFVMFGSYSLAFWYASTLVRDGIHNVGEIVACFFAVLISSFSLGMVAAPMADINSARGAAKVIYDTIERVPPIDIRKKGKIIPDLKGEITFKNVKFVYPTRKDQLILDNFNLVIEPGKALAFVGPSGCGKSSIVGLVLRFYDPMEGDIFVDGINLKELDLKWWRDQVGIVSQEPSLFSGTVMTNVKAGNPNITDDEVLKACKDAFIHETISKLPKKYDTDVGSLGSQLSGGQKQRIAIARALVKKPKILLLDEATSALDRRSEIKVQRAIDSLLSGTRTTIMIAHRLVTIKDCHVINVIERVPVQRTSGEPYGADEEEKTVGVITERGTFTELVEKGGKFASLVKAQVRTNQRSRNKSIENTSDADLIAAALRQSDTIVDVDEVTPPGTPRASDEEKKEELPKIPMSRLVQANAQEWWAIVIGIIGGVIGGAVYPFYAVVFSEMITVLATKKGADMDTEGPFWAMLFLVIAGGSLIAYTLQFGFFGYAGEKLTERIRVQLFSALIRNEIAFFDVPGHEPGALGAILSGDTEAIHSLYGPALCVKVSSFSTLACSFGIGFWYSWKLSLVCMTAVPAVALAGMANMAFMGGFGDAKNSDVLEVAGKIAHEATSNIRTIFAFNMHKDVDERYGACILERERIGRKTALSSGFMFGFGQFVMFAAFALAFWYGGKLISEGEEDFNSVMIASMAIMMASMGIGESSAMWAKYNDAEASAQKVFNLIDRKPLMDMENRGGEIPAELRTGDLDIQFKNVFFNYPTRPSTCVLRDFTLHIPEKKHIALIGSTGCGKSTVMQLIQRFYDPCVPKPLAETVSNPGTVSIKNVDMKSLGLGWWRSQMAIVSQEPALFEGSIRDNITYGMDVVTEERIHEAAQLAKLHDDVMQFPDKYDTDVGAHGSKLSGGQKQRVAIARAIIRKPRVLLLDEATSALDNKSEAEVQRAIDNIINTMGMTVVTIAHRMTTIEGADVIGVLDGGVLVEKGSHDELMALGGDYKERYEQYHAQGPQNS